MRFLWPSLALPASFAAIIDDERTMKKSSTLLMQPESDLIQNTEEGMESPR